MHPYKQWCFIADFFRSTCTEDAVKHCETLLSEPPLGNKELNAENFEAFCRYFVRCQLRMNLFDQTHSAVLISSWYSMQNVRRTGWTVRGHLMMLWQNSHVWQTAIDYIHNVKPCPHCRRKVRLSQKSSTVAEKKWDCLATVAVFFDSRTFLGQCGQGFRLRSSCETGHFTKSASILPSLWKKWKVKKWLLCPGPISLPISWNWHSKICFYVYLDVWCLGCGLSTFS